MNLHFRHENIGNISNLILNIEESMVIDSFAIHMIGRNRIEAILPLQLNQFNNDIYLRYDITGMQTLKGRLKAVWNKNEIFEFLNSIINAYEEVDTYMLTCTNMYLDEEYIFMDENNNCKFLYIPMEEFTGEDIISVLHKLVNKIEPDYTEKDNFFFKILNAFNRGAIVKISDLKELLRKSKEEPEEIATEYKMETVIPLKQEIKEEYADKAVNIEMPERAEGIDLKMNFAIPGIKNEKKAEKKSEKKIGKREESGSEKKETKKSAIPVKSIPQTAGIVFEIPGISNHGKQQNVQEESVEEEKQLKKESKDKFSFFNKKVKAKDDPGFQKKNSLEDVMFEEREKDQEMYECYEETIILNPSEQEEADATVLMEEEITKALLIRNSNEDRFEIIESDIIIGAGSLANYRIENNRKISRRHASIRVECGHYFIRDNNSSNGTYVNGKRLSGDMEEELKDNDMIRLADEEFIFRI